MRSASLADKPMNLTVAFQIRPVAARDAGQLEAAVSEMVTKCIQVIPVSDS